MNSLQPLPFTIGLIACISLLTVCKVSAQSSGNDIPTRPNIVLINLDDADAGLLSSSMLQNYYPNMRRMAQQGMRFTNLHATTPFCAPSRAALMRGQYAFETGIKVNEPGAIHANGFTGGYGEFVARGHDQQELGVWLKNAGYRTMHVGKYHHHNFDNRVPSGWDEFRVTLGAKYFGTFRFTNETDPAGSFQRTADDDYITQEETDDAIELIDQHSGSDQPFFLYLAPIAPHTPQSFVPEDMVEPRYRNFAAGLTIPNTPDLYEADFSDKPRHLRFSTPAAWRQFNQRTFISRVRAMKSVDDMVGELFESLENNGKAENTIVFLTSDNGYQNGQHNLHNKTDPFHRTTNVPLLVTGPGIDAGVSASHLLAHIDLCPTILQLAAAPIADTVSAKSFRPLLFNHEHFNEQNWQDGILIENWSKKRNYNFTTIGSYVAYRQHHEIFVSWVNGQYEYYNLQTDPYQLNNRYSELTTTRKQELKRLVRRFRTKRSMPTTTLDPTYRDVTQNSNVKIRGYAEDDAGVFGTLVTMKSFTTGRFWNGQSWQDEWSGHFIDAKNRNQPLSLWAFRTRVQTETPSGFDYLVFAYRSLDSDGVLPHEVNFHINPIDGKRPVANFNNYGNEVPRFGPELTLQGTHFDAIELKGSRMTIRDGKTNEYFDGQKFVEQRVDFPVTNRQDGTWRTTLNLPTGKYIAGIRAIDAVGNVQHPANLLRFRVVPLDQANTVD